MTVYNAEPYLKEAVDSLFAQTFSQWELVVVENGSTDGSPQILDGYNAGRIRMLRCPVNIGRTKALRLAFDSARGDYIAVLDADDAALPERLELQARYLDTHPDVVLVATWAQFIDAKGAITATFEPPTASEKIRECIAWTNPVIHSSAMFRRDAAVQAGGYPASLAYAQDLGLIAALAGIGEIAVIPLFLCRLRVLSTSLTRLPSQRIRAGGEILELLEGTQRTFATTRHAQRMNRHARAIAMVRLGIALLLAGEVARGARMAIAGLLLAPSVIWENGKLQTGKWAEACCVKRS